MMHTTQHIPESQDDPVLKEVLSNIQIKDANSVLKISSTELLVSRQTPFLYEYILLGKFSFFLLVACL